MAGENPYAQFVTEPNPYAAYLKPATTFKIGAEGLPDAAAESVLNTNPLEQAMHGSKAAAQNTWIRLKQMVGQEPGPEYLKNPAAYRPQSSPMSLEDQRQVGVNRAILKQSPMAMLGGIGTDMAMTAPLAGPVYSGVKNAASAVLPGMAGRLLAPSAGAGASGALTAAATQPVLPGEDNAAGAGFVGGIFGDALLRGGGRLVQPITQSEPVKKLLSANVVPTIGQAAGGMMGRLEEKASSLPLIGDVIRNSRTRANQELNVAQLQKIDPTIEVGGRAGIQQADEAVNKAYRSALAGIPEVKMTQAFEDNVRQGVVNDPVRMLGTEQRNTIEKFLDSSIFSNFKNNNGVITGEQAKVLDSKIGEAIRNASDNGVRNAMRDIQSEFRGLLKDGATTPEAAKALSTADKKYKDFMIAVRATAKPGAEDGFTPSQLAQSVREGDRSKDKRAYAKGTAYGQDLSDAAKAVLSDKVPNSGTTDRALAALLLGGAGAAASHNDVPGANMFGPAYWMGLGASPLLYSRAGSRLFMGDLPGVGALQRGTAGALNQMSPYAAQAGALYPYQ